MKKLGTLFGAELLLDTEDEWVIENAEKLLKEMFEKRFHIKTDAELDAEVRQRLKR